METYDKILSFCDEIKDFIENVIPSISYSSTMGIFVCPNGKLEFYIRKSNSFIYLKSFLVKYDHVRSVKSLFKDLDEYNSFIRASINCRSAIHTSITVMDYLSCLLHKAIENIILDPEQYSFEYKQNECKHFKTQYDFVRIYNSCKDRHLLQDFESFFQDYKWLIYYCNYRIFVLNNEIKRIESL